MSGTTRTIQQPAGTGSHVKNPPRRNGSFPRHLSKQAGDDPFLYLGMTVVILSRTVKGGLDPFAIDGLGHILVRKSCSRPLNSVGRTMNGA